MAGVHHRGTGILPVYSTGKPVPRVCQKILPCAAILVYGGAAAAAMSLAAVRARADDASPSLAFIAAGKEYRFDTGALRGTLRAGGKSQGLGPVEDVGAGKAIARSVGLLSPYRLLTSDARFGTAAWDWASQARLSDKGGVEVCWKADREHPLEMTAEYRFAAADTIDLKLAVKPQRNLHGFELFLASYFEGFERTFAYVGSGCRKKKVRNLDWSRQPAGTATGRSSRATRRRSGYTATGGGSPPNPVDWVVRGPLAAPLALRRDTDPAPGGLAVALMAPAADCFALAMPYGEEPHRSVYLSLFGRDLKAGEVAVARVRLAVRHGLTDEKAVELYREFAGRSR